MDQTFVPIASKQQSIESWFFCVCINTLSLEVEFIGMQTLKILYCIFILAC